MNDHATVRHAAAPGAWPSIDTLFGDDPYDDECGIFPDAKAATGAKTSSRIRALCGLAAASAWMILAAAVGVLQRT